MFVVTPEIRTVYVERGAIAVGNSGTQEKSATENDFKGVRGRS